MVVEFRRRGAAAARRRARGNAKRSPPRCLRDSIPKLARSSPHRYLERHGIPRLPENPDKVSKAKPLGSRRVRLRRAPRRRRKDERGRLPAQRRRSVPPCHPRRADRQRHGLRRPAEEPQRTDAAIPRRPVFDRARDERGTGHKLAKPCHPWANGQAERMNRTVKEATTKAFRHPGLGGFKAHVLAFVPARNAAKRLKTLWWQARLRGRPSRLDDDARPFPSSTRNTSSREQADSSERREERGRTAADPPARCPMEGQPSS